MHDDLRDNALHDTNPKTTSSPLFNKINTQIVYLLCIKIL
jgi:hypothetical protein